MSIGLRTRGAVAAASLIVASAVPFAVANPASAAHTTTPIPTSVGQDFWMAFPTNYSVGHAVLDFFISGDTAGTGTVSAPAPGGSGGQTFTITPGQVTAVQVDASLSVTASDGVENKGVEVTTTVPASVYADNHLPYSSTGWLGLPLEALGTDYRALGYTTNGFGLSQMTVVATQDNTVLTITPATTVDTHAAGASFTETVNAGQTYQLQATTNVQDITGTTVTSTHPIAVMGGNSCADIPLSAGACDEVAQELAPTNAWGTHFATVHYATRTLGDTYRVLADQDNTVVSVNGSVAATLNAGEFYEAVLPAGSTSSAADNTQIDSTKPVEVAQYGNGTSYDGTTGDPLMLLVPPTGQFLSSYTISAPALTNLQDSTPFAPYANVVARTADVGQVILDGTAIAANQYTAIGTSGYSGAQLSITAGTHSFSGPHQFGLQIYEWGAADAIGFPGGMAVAPIANAPAPPTTSDRTSTGVQGATQTITLAVPNGGTAALLDGFAEVTSLTVANEGSYTVDATSGVVVFTPLPGFTGVATPVTYRVTDGFNQSSDSTYTPTVTGTPPVLTPPDPPTAVDVQAGDGQVDVSWSAPADHGSAAISGYIVTPYINGVAQTPVPIIGTGTSTTITGLTNGTAYTFTVAAVSDDGTGNASGPSDAVTPLPPAPSPADLTTSGSGDGASVTPVVPSGGSITLLTTLGGAVTSLNIAGQGEYTVNPYTSVITFVAVRGFTGIATPVTYRVTDQFGQTGDATVTAHVTTATTTVPPGAPTGVTAQAGNGRALVSWSRPEVSGTSDITGYVVTPYVDGVAQTPVPVTGTGTSTTITGLTNGTEYTFKVAAVSDDGTGDLSGASNAVTPLPPAPTAPELGTSGSGNGASVVAPVPAGGSITLLTATGVATNMVKIAGQGSYVLNPATGQITFVAVAGFTGTVTPVSYRVVDAFNRSATGTVTAHVTSKATPVGPPPTPSKSATVTVEHLSVASKHHTVPLTCHLDTGHVRSCDVGLYATVSGRAVRVGHGVATGTTGTGTSLKVTVSLTTLGRSLIQVAGGFKFRARASVVPRTGRTLNASATGRFVSKTVTLAATVHFATGKSTLRTGARDVIAALRHKMGAITGVLCVGNTDNSGAKGENKALGLRRAKTTCAYVVRKLSHIKTTTRTHGETAPTKSNKTKKGRAANRRVDITLEY